MSRQKGKNKLTSPQPQPLPEPQVIPLEDRLDLHTFRPQDLGTLIPEYLELCHRRGLLEVKLIHGKGTGALKARVQAILKRHPLVAGFADADPRGGGWGATLVYLTSESQ
ncbi:MAG: Smr/MutS family protein [Deltaproteobacteria bacterium]|nr:Smr/MutS family protein [Deltaproteobacteria bacterium]MBW1953284.1 Smr/MutS family protein [Deltaproteobacteria bacterium]MBW1987445.1 Smr/MutS family protein [Deltaproteobacteria bacterium]MBW2135518.1 Smr/MutS family protein [Deltaproteobacteria bacterium]